MDTVAIDADTRTTCREYRLGRQAQCLDRHNGLIHKPAVGQGQQQKLARPSRRTFCLAGMVTSRFLILGVMNTSANSLSGCVSSSTDPVCQFRTLERRQQKAALQRIMKTVQVTRDDRRSAKLVSKPPYHTAMVSFALLQRTSGRPMRSDREP